MNGCNAVKKIPRPKDFDFSCIQLLPAGVFQEADFSDHQTINEVSCL